LTPVQVSILFKVMSSQSLTYLGLLKYLTPSKKHNSKILLDLVQVIYFHLPQLEQVV
jgi:hypothetical protein